MQNLFHFLDHLLILCNNGEWVTWTTKVLTIKLLFEEVLYSWLLEHKPLMLCGPPGSGKTMTFYGTLRKLPDIEVVGLLKTLNNIISKDISRYNSSGCKVFCDEINLPATEKYGTSFMRQLIEHGGYWRSDKESDQKVTELEDKCRVSESRIQILEDALQSTVNTQTKTSQFEDLEKRLSKITNELSVFS